MHREALKDAVPSPTTGTHDAARAAPVILTLTDAEMEARRLVRFLRDGYEGCPAFLVEDDERLRVHVLVEVPDGDEAVPVVMPVWLPGPGSMRFVASDAGVDHHKILGRQYRTMTVASPDGRLHDTERTVGAFARGLLGLRRMTADCEPGFGDDIQSRYCQDAPAHLPRLLRAWECRTSLATLDARPDLVEAAEDARQAVEARLRRLYAFDGVTMLEVEDEPYVSVTCEWDGRLAAAVATVSNGAPGRTLEVRFSMAEHAEARTLTAVLCAAFGRDLDETWGVFVGNTTTSTRLADAQVRKLARSLVPVLDQTRKNWNPAAHWFLSVLLPGGSGHLGWQPQWPTWSTRHEWREIWRWSYHVLGPHQPLCSIDGHCAKTRRRAEVTRLCLDVLAFGEVIRHPDYGASGPGLDDMMLAALAGPQGQGPAKEDVASPRPPLRRRHVPVPSRELPDSLSRPGDGRGHEDDRNVPF